MRAFHKNFIFNDELSITSLIDDTLDSIRVIQQNDCLLSDMFRFQSPWVTMTGRNVRYYTNIAFDDSQDVDIWALEIEDVLTLIWNGESDTIIYIEGEKYAAKLLQFWVLHTFYPLVLELANIYHILHVSGIQIKDKTILFSAQSGGGKSTLIDYFIKKKYTIVGDDTVAINVVDNSYEVIASYPFHRPYRKAEVLGYPIVNFATKVHTLAHMYTLEKSEGDAKVEIVELKGIEKFKIIYQSMFVTFESRQKERYLFSVEMAKYVKVYKITVPWNISRLEEVYQEILTHIEV